VKLVRVICILMECRYVLMRKMLSNYCISCSAYCKCWWNCCFVHFIVISRNCSAVWGSCYIIWYLFSMSLKTNWNTLKIILYIYDLMNPIVNKRFLTVITWIQVFPLINYMKRKVYTKLIYIKKGQYWRRSCQFSNLTPSPWT